MSTRIDTRMAALKAAGRSGLIPFVTAGDPHPDWMAEVLHALVEGGADVLELGMPFSDPMADGPVIQKSSERALARGMTLDRTLAIVRAFRERDAETPVVLMGYLNPVEIRGAASFSAAAADAGVDGVHQHGAHCGCQPCTQPVYREFGRSCKALQGDACGPAHQ